MEIKLFEVRDKGTFIPVMAIRLGTDSEQERFLLARAGYGANTFDFERYVLLAEINGGYNMKISYDCYSWSRTLKHTHEFIKENFSDLKSGEVIDVEFILGESKTKKASENYNI